MGTGREKHSAGNSVCEACRRKPIKGKGSSGHAEVEAGMSGSGVGEMDWRGKECEAGDGRGR